MFYNTLHVLIRKLWNFLQCFVSAAIFAGALILLFLMNISKEICNSVCIDLVAFGIVFLVCRVTYVCLVNRYYAKTQKKKHHGTHRKAPKPQQHTVVASTPVISVAPITPVAKPMFFDYEEHQ